MKITVGITVYNKATYIAECLNSIMYQTYPNLEILVVDDCSTDESVAIIKQFEQKDSRIKLIQHEKNQGLGGSRNTVIQYATGDYLGYVDADDVLKPTMYEKLAQLAMNEQADLVYANLFRFVHSVLEPLADKVWFRPSNGPVTPETIRRNCQPYNKIVSMDLVRKLQFQFFERNGDSAYVKLMIAANKMVSLDDKLYGYRLDYGSMSNTFGVAHIVESLKYDEILLKEVHEFPEFMEFRTIQTLLQLMMVSCKFGDKQHYMEAKNKLKTFDFKQNLYLPLFKEDYSPLLYFAMLHILPINYHISKFLVVLLRK